MTNRIELLARVPLFAGLSKKTLERLDTGFVERQYPAGADIVTEDKGGIAFFVIVEGTAEILHRPGSAAVRTLKPGDCFGEIALIDGGARSATVRAAGPVTCLAMTSWDFMAEVRTNIDLAVHLLQVMTARVRDLEARRAEAESLAGTATS
jgi:CRP/FNR family transcriptional regulator, cyclic AMP receptor protein